MSSGALAADAEFRNDSGDFANAQWWVTINSQ
jgi:hypothetical protein